MKKKNNKRGEGMNKFIEFIKRIFGKNKPLLDKGETKIEERNLNQKESFFNDIKIDNNIDTILVLQKKLENGTIEEINLNDKQIRELKELYYNQIINLVDSINNYKLKLNIIQKS